MLNCVASLLNLLMIGTVSAATMATLPQADRKGTKDSPLLKRYEGSYIVVHESKLFGEFTLPLSKLEPVKEQDGAEQSAIRTEGQEAARGGVHANRLSGPGGPFAARGRAQLRGRDQERRREPDVPMQGGRLRRRRFAEHRGRRRVDEPRDVPVPSGARSGRTLTRRVFASSARASPSSVTSPRKFRKAAPMSRC